MRRTSMVLTVALLGLVIQISAASAAASGIRGAVLDSTCSASCPPPCPPPCHAALPCAAPRLQAIICPERSGSPIPCAESGGCPPVSPYPRYTGGDAHVLIRRTGSTAILARRDPHASRFSLRLGPGRYVVRAYVSKPCWQGDRASVVVEAGRFASVSVDVWNACVAHPGQGQNTRAIRARPIISSGEFDRAAPAGPSTSSH